MSECSSWIQHSHKSSQMDDDSSNCKRTSFFCQISTSVWWKRFPHLALLFWNFPPNIVFGPSLNDVKHIRLGYNSNISIKYTVLCLTKKNHPLIFFLLRLSEVILLGGKLKCVKIHLWYEWSRGKLCSLATAARIWQLLIFWSVSEERLQSWTGTGQRADLAIEIFVLALLH